MKTLVREAVRALVLDPNERVLLLRYRSRDGGRTWWATPGGAVEPNETEEDAILRELREETGLSVQLGPCLWTREHRMRWEGEDSGVVMHGHTILQRERFFLARASSCARDPSLSEDILQAERIESSRWWTISELETTTEDVTLRRLAALVRQLVNEGAPPCRSTAARECVGGAEQARLPGRPSGRRRRSCRSTAEPARSD